MVSIVFGLFATSLGIWGLVTYWWYTVDVIIAIFPLVLLLLGLIALLAGIKNTGLKASLVQRKNRKASESATTSRDW